MVKVDSFTDTFSNKWTFVSVNRLEALAIIKSLSAQLLNGSPNSERAEQRCGDHEFFTLAVVE